MKSNAWYSSHLVLSRLQLDWCNFLLHCLTHHAADQANIENRNQRRALPLYPHKSVLWPLGWSYNVTQMIGLDGSASDGKQSGSKLQQLMIAIVCFRVCSTGGCLHKWFFMVEKRSQYKNCWPSLARRRAELQKTSWLRSQNPEFQTEPMEKSQLSGQQIISWPAEVRPLNQPWKIRFEGRGECEGSITHFNEGQGSRVYTRLALSLENSRPREPGILKPDIHIDHNKWSMWTLGVGLLKTLIQVF